MGLDPDSTLGGIISIASVISLISSIVLLSNPSNNHPEYLSTKIIKWIAYADFLMFLPISIGMIFPFFTGALITSFYIQSMLWTATLAIYS